MKKFTCADIIPGCDHSFHGATENELVAIVAQHAISNHGISEFNEELDSKIRGVIVDHPAL